MLQTTNSDTSPLLAEKDREECTERSLYIRFPHTIKDKEEVEEHLIGNDYTVKLTRQAERHCLVEFSSVEEKLKNQKALSKKFIDGKRVIARGIKANFKKSSQKKPRKKIRVPKVEPDVRITQTLYVSNIKCGASVQEVKEALPGCVNVTFLKPYSINCRSAVVKMESLQTAREYLTHKKESPEIRGLKLELHADKRRKHKKKKKLKPNVLSNDVDA